jgi:TolA-binding protein
VPHTPASVPASPTAIYNNAKNYFYNGDYKNAITLLENAITRYPDSPEAVLAQSLIGDSWVSLGGHNPEALAAYALVIKNYTDPDRVADAFYKQGQVYEATNQKDLAIKSYQDCIQRFPNNSAATFSTMALKRLGIIK